MNLTKDELRILSVALNESKYDLIEEFGTKEMKLKAINALNNLEIKVETFQQLLGN